MTRCRVCRAEQEPNVSITLSTVDGMVLATGEHDYGASAPPRNHILANLVPRNNLMGDALTKYLGHDILATGLQLSIVSRGPREPQ